MPTAVERLLDSFLKLAGFGDRREQDVLNDAFLKIDGDLLKLSSANADTFVKLEHNHALKLDFDVIGDAFIKLGRSFDHFALAGARLDDFVLKVTGATSGVFAAPAVAAEGAPNPQADFLKLDGTLKTSATDLKILGTDFLKLDTSPNLETFQLKIKGVSNDFLKLSGDMAANGDAFHKLGDDFLKLGGNFENPSPLDFAYKELGGELNTVGSQFGVLSTDFLNLVPAVQAGGGGGTGLTASDSFVKLSVGLDLMTLSQDFHKLDIALGEVGDGAAAVIGDLFRQSFAVGGGHGTG
jgi:hypothetical protein